MRWFTNSSSASIGLRGEVIRVQQAVVRAGGKFKVTTPKAMRATVMSRSRLTAAIIENHLANHVKCIVIRCCSRRLEVNTWPLRSGRAISPPVVHASSITCRSSTPVYLP